MKVESNLRFKNSSIKFTLSRRLNLHVKNLNRYNIIENQWKPKVRLPKELFPKSIWKFPMKYVCFHFRWDFSWSNRLKRINWAFFKAVKNSESKNPQPNLFYVITGKREGFSVENHRKEQRKEISFLLKKSSKSLPHQIESHRIIWIYRIPWLPRPLKIMRSKWDNFGDILRTTWLIFSWGDFTLIATFIWCDFFYIYSVVIFHSILDIQFKRVPFWVWCSFSDIWGSPQLIFFHTVE